MDQKDQEMVVGPHMGPKGPGDGSGFPYETIRTRRWWWGLIWDQKDQEMAVGSHMGPYGPEGGGGSHMVPVAPGYGSGGSYWTIRTRRWWWVLIWDQKDLEMAVGSHMRP